MKKENAQIDKNYTYINNILFKKIVKYIFPYFLILLMIFSCSEKKEPQQLEQIILQLGWYHQSQWAGFYAADQNVYYNDEGIEITFLPRPSPNFYTIDTVVDGTAHFVTTNGFALISARSKGIPVVAIASLYQKDPQVFITLAESNIIRPEDFPGHTIRKLTPTANGAIFNTMMNRLGLNPDSVIQIDAGFEMTPFFEGKIDIWPCFLNDEVLFAREQGYDVNIIFPGYYGAHMYGMVLVTSEEFIEEDPELVFHFLKATLKGWKWAIEHYEEAASFALNYNPELDIDHEIRLFEASIPLIHTGQDELGWMTEDIWDISIAILVEQGIISNPPDSASFYTTEFLEKIYNIN